MMQIDKNINKQVLLTSNVKRNIKEREGGGGRNNCKHFVLHSPYTFFKHVIKCTTIHGQNLF